MTKMARGCAVIAIAVLATACGKQADRAPAPELTGLAAVPSTAEVVIGVDVEKLGASPLVERAAAQLLLRDAQLAASWEHVREACKIDVQKQVKRLMIALGPAAPNARPGTGPVLMVATGALVETDLASCMRSLVGKGGGTLTAKPLGGRTLYQVKEGNRTMFWSFGRPDTVVLGNTEAYVVEALGEGKKALDHPELAAWIKLADQNAPVWAVGRVSERVRQGLVRVTEGKLKAGPLAFVGSLDPTSGAKLDLGAVMSSGDDAKALESQAKTQLAGLVMIAQLKSLGTLVQKLVIAVEGSVVRFRASLSMDDVNHVLSMLDGGRPPAQDSPPAPGPGSSSPASQ
ncbi:MAG: hypothetical protein H0T89_33475 [Deltaproteobacteria bacterium]|nr:hypothetical protein [Deltaproteobacteria bacterium]